MAYTSFETIDKEGKTQTFKYKYETELTFEREKWHFVIVPEDEVYDDFFYLGATAISDDTLKITTVNRHNQIIYSAKGITEKIIQILALLSGKKVISSTNNPAFKFFDEEFRTPAATKVWQRVVQQGFATYDAETDIFSLHEKLLN